MNYTLKVRQSFSRGASLYDDLTPVQAVVAEKLAENITVSHKNPHILEIGCGTGLLSSHLIPKWPRYVMTDMSTDMVLKAREKFKNVMCVVTDGQSPCFKGTFDLVVSSMSLHWFKYPQKALLRWIECLKPGGSLHFTAMGSASFSEWRRAHESVGVPCATPDFVSENDLVSSLPGSTITQSCYEVPVSNPLAYFKELKLIGAGTSHPHHTPLSPKNFKRVLEAFRPVSMLTYQIFEVHFKKEINHEK